MYTYHRVLIFPFQNIIFDVLRNLKKNLTINLGLPILIGKFCTLEFTCNFILRVYVVGFSVGYLTQFFRRARHCWAVGKVLYFSLPSPSREDLYWIG